MNVDSRAGQYEIPINGSRKPRWSDRDLRGLITEWGLRQRDGTNAKQPPRLASSRNRSTSSLLHKDATEMEPCKIRGTTQPLVSRTGAGR